MFFELRNLVMKSFEVLKLISMTFAMKLMGWIVGYALC